MVKYINEYSKITMESKTQLVPQTQLAPILARQEKLMAIESKIFIQLEERLIKSIALNYPDLFIKLISTFYPLPEYLINMYKDRWIWMDSNSHRKFGLSMNKSLLWSMELIEKFKDKWNWYDLSCNPILPWTVELFEKYKDKWNFHALSGNNSFPFSEKILIQHEDKWNWGSLSSNTSLPWSMELIEKYKYRWNWNFQQFSLSGNPSLPWSWQLVEKYKDEWGWGFLRENPAFKKEWLVWRSVWDYTSEEIIIRAAKDNPNKIIGGDAFFLSDKTFLPWTIDYIEKYEDEWYWPKLSENPSLPWSIELIEKYKDKWGWRGRVSSKDFELVEKYKDKWNWFGLSKTYKKVQEATLIINNVRELGDKWEGLSRNTGLPWSLDLIERYKDKWDWYELSKNHSIPWSEELIEKFIDKWSYTSLSMNRSVPWTDSIVELIDTYLENQKQLYIERKWSSYMIERKNKELNELCEALSNNTSLPWSVELIIKFQNKWDYNTLSKNKSISWTIGLIEKFKDQLDLENLSNREDVYEKAFKPYLTDSLIDEIMQKII